MLNYQKQSNLGKVFPIFFIAACLKGGGGHAFVLSF